MPDPARPPSAGAAGISLPRAVAAAMVPTSMAVMPMFLAGTLVATVYLGWHFFVDDVAGLAIAALAWWLAPRTVGVRRRLMAERPPAKGPAS